MTSAEAVIASFLLKSRGRVTVAKRKTKAPASVR